MVYLDYFRALPWGQGSDKMMTSTSIKGVGEKARRVVHMAATITPAQFAEVVGTDGRTVRKFLRSITPKDEQPGKGARWTLPGTKRDVTKLQKRYEEWASAQAAARAEREAEVEETNEEIEESEDA